VRKLEVGVGRLEGSSSDLDSKLHASVASMQDAQRSEAMQRAASHHTLHTMVTDIRERQDRSPVAVSRNSSTPHLPPNTVYVASPPSVSMTAGSTSGPLLSQASMASRTSSVACSAAAAYDGARTPPQMKQSVSSLTSSQTFSAIPQEPRTAQGSPIRNSRSIVARPGYFHP
jgi:hypothetical protein